MTSQLQDVDEHRTRMAEVLADKKKAVPPANSKPPARLVVPPATLSATLSAKLAPRSRPGLAARAALKREPRHVFRVLLPVVETSPSPEPADAVRAVHPNPSAAPEDLQARASIRQRMFERLRIFSGFV